MTRFGDILSYRGHTVVDSAGETLGRLEEIHLDQDASRPEWGRLVLGDRRALVPLIGASAVGDRVEIAYARKAVFDAPKGDRTELHRYYLRVGEGIQGLGALGPPPDWP